MGQVLLQNLFEKPNMFLNLKLSPYTYVKSIVALLPDSNSKLPDVQFDCRGGPSLVTVQTNSVVLIYSFYLCTTTFELTGQEQWCVSNHDTDMSCQGCKAEL